MKMRLVLIFLFVVSALQAQFVPVHMSYQHVYDFVDELANDGVIEINSAVRPYSRKQIAQLLHQADIRGEELNTRQSEQLQFYIQEFRLENGSNKFYRTDVDLIRKENRLSVSVHPAGVFYADTSTTLAITPILGAVYYANNNGNMYHRWVGAQMYGNFGNWGFYGSLRDNAENHPFSSKNYLVNRTGGNYKSTDYSEMRGGVTYANKWFAAGLVKDHLSWGTNYHGSNIFSTRTPSIAQFKVAFKPAKWFELNSFNGWLVSHQIDSINSIIFPDGSDREVMLKKFISANIFTLYPWKHTTFAFGNSVVYTGETMNLAYLIPFLTYKADTPNTEEIRPTGKSAGHNTQFFMDVSFRAIKHLHLYYSLFADDLKTERWSKVDEHNHFSYKTGAKLSNWPVRNIRLGVEYTKSQPMTYGYDAALTTFKSNDYTLGHYLKDNAEEVVFDARFQPIAALWFDIIHTKARKGESYIFDRSSEDLYKHGFIENEVWSMTTTETRFTFQSSYNVLITGSLCFSDVKGDMATVYTPKFYQGKQLTFSLGVTVGF